LDLLGRCFSFFIDFFYEGLVLICQLKKLSLSTFI
jgi:hypothetical protein